MSERLTDEQLRGYASAEYSLPFAHAMADELLALRARVAQLEAALVEVGDFLADDCVENYPFDRIPGSFADEADRLLKLIKASVGDAPRVGDSPTRMSLETLRLTLSRTRPNELHQGRTHRPIPRADRFSQTPDAEKGEKR